MCELKAILVNGEERRQVMESVTRVVVNDSLIEMTGIFGEKETIEGKIKEINFSSGELLISGNE
jgi:predicted RNA-binding protein